MILMTEALPGAAALLIVAASLAILTPVLIAFSQLSWQGIAKALLTLAGVFLVIGVAGLLLTPLVPVLLGIGAAIALLGIGVLAAGAGVLLFAAGLTALAIAITASGAAILSFGTNIIALIPAIFKQLGLGVIAFADVIGSGGPALAKAIEALLTALLVAIIKIAPEAAKAFGALLDAILTIIPKYVPQFVKVIASLLLTVIDTIVSYFPKYVNAGVQLLVSLLNGIANNIPKVAAAATRIAEAFITAIGTNSLAVIHAGAEMIINFLNGLAAEINRDAPRLRAAAGAVGIAIIDGATDGLFSKAAGFLVHVENLGQSAIDTFMHAIGARSPAKKFIPAGEAIPDGVVVGITNNTSNMTDSINTLGDKAVKTMQASLSTLGDTVNTGIDFSPTITPVLDLTQVQQGFQDLQNMTKSQLIAASASTSVASSISAGQSVAPGVKFATAPTTQVTYNQTNNSPVTLSNAEIYRQTKNLLSTTKGALTANAG
jgi:hypothetical protein